MFLQRALIPLHKPKCVSLYHQQLSYCITQYVEKDVGTSINILKGLISFWPWSCSQKQVLFLNELEDTLELTQPPEFHRMQEQLFRRIAWCIICPQYQVAERALTFWNNDEYIEQFKLDAP